MKSASVNQSVSADLDFRIFTILALLGAGFSLALLGLRMASAISLTEPLQLHTTGDEFSTQFPIWRQIQGLNPYTDRFSPPFSYAVYNWLFYDFYGVVTGAVLKLFSLGDAWLPTIGRFISLASMVVGIVVSYMVFARASEAKDGTLKLLSLAFAVFIMAGPLVGFWNITVRSDLWARTLEIIAVAVFFAKYPHRRWQAILWFILFAYLSWSFKQGNVFAAGAVGLFLLVRKDWKPLVLLSVVLPALWGATLLLGDPQYVYNVLFKDFPLLTSSGRMFRNILNFTVKSGPTLLFLAGLAVVSVARSIRWSEYWRSDAFMIGLGGSIGSALISVPVSAQSGGAENYFFSLSFFLALMVVASFPILRRSEGPALRHILIAGGIGWVTLIAAIVMVFSGVTGVIDVRHQHVTNMAGKRCLDTLPRPLFVNNSMLSLPWITSNDVHWVRSYNYYDDRRVGNAFKEGGIGGLIEKGRFKVVALSKGGTAPPTEYDGGSLSGYRLMKDDAVIRRTCPEFFIFFRSPTN